MTRLALLLAALAAAPAFANMAAPTQPGAPAGEPPVALVGLTVLHERLVLDLRPLASRGDARTALVEAEYTVVNSGAARRVPLSFVALGDDPRAAEVWLDGTPVAAQWVDTLAVPEAWHVATTTPALGGADPLPFETFRWPVRGLAFVLDIPPGQHAVRVRYRVEAGSHDTGTHPMRTWQVGYSLAPARFWAGFGVLDVQVVAPLGWDVAASLPLRRETSGGRTALVGQFRGVPGDVLTVSARAPAPAGRLPIRLAGLAVALLAVVGAGRLGALASRWWLVLIVALAGGGLAALALVVSSVAAAGLGDSGRMSYGAVFTGAFVVAPIAFLIGTGAAYALARRWRRARERQTA